MYGQFSMDNFLSYLIMATFCLAYDNDTNYNGM